jgi:hypothetical protein
MNRHIFISGVLGVLSLHGQAISNAAAGQSLGIGLGNGLNASIDSAVKGELFQALSNLSGARVLDEGFGNRTVKGKPFSATEERHFLQVLGDGTRIETSETNRLYRDTEGRARVEEMNGTITIYDPVANFTVELDPAAKTARRRSGANYFHYSSEGGSVSITNMSPFGSSIVTGRAGQNNQSALKGVMAETTENLGSQSVNGVTAQGMRTTMTIPKGQIGNNKDIKVLTERWSSNDLQMLVKSINSDPRFGDTTYQLTKVVQSAPDQALFQIPADYTVTGQTTPDALRSLKRELNAPAAARPGARAPLAPVPPAPPAPPAPAPK